MTETVTETIELPTELMREAVDAVVPYLAVSRTDRSNSYATWEFSRAFVEALADELEAGDLFCDHSVGICCCGPIAALRELRLRLDGRMTCPSCGGDGFQYVPAEDEYDDGMIRCPRCGGTGETEA